MRGRHTAIKILLILAAEALAMYVTNLISDHVIYIPHTTITYLISGAVLAYAIVTLYDKAIDRRRKRIERELKNITDVALIKYKIHDRKQ